MNTAVNSPGSALIVIATKVNMNKIYVIGMVNGSYDAIEHHDLFAVRSEIAAKEAVELLNKYAEWIDDEWKKQQAFSKEWNENNPQPWTNEEQRKFSHRLCMTSLGPMEDREDYKEFFKRKNKWLDDSHQALLNYKGEDLPKEFTKIHKEYGVTYNDDLSYGYVELDILYHSLDKDNE